MIPLDRLHTPHKFPTHKDQCSVQVLVVLLYQVLVVLVRLPLVLVVELGAGSHGPTRDGGKIRSQSSFQGFLDPEASSSFGAT